MNPLPVDMTNLTNYTDFLRLVDELNRTNIPRALTRGNKIVAMLLPVATNAQDVPSSREYHPDGSFGSNVIDLETQTDIERVKKQVRIPTKESHLLLTMAGIFKGPKDLSQNKKKYM